MTSSISSGAPRGDWLGTPHMRFERHGSLARCIVDRPEKRNAMTGAMYFAVRYAIDLVNRDDSLSGLLLTGTDDVFIPGGDMSGEGSAGEDYFHSLILWENTPFEALRLSRKPVVSAVNGIAQGGGLMIAMLSDIAVASDRATFRAPELLRGIADTHYGQILPRQIGPARARDLMLTGRVLTAHEAERWGLITRVVPHEQLLDAATETLVACCRTGPNARTMFKMDLDRYYGRFNRIAMESPWGSEESAEGFAAFKARRAPSWVPEDLLPEEGGRL